MEYQELLTLVAQLSAANLKLRETIDRQRQRLEDQELRLANCSGGCACSYPQDCDGSCACQAPLVD